LAKKNDDKRPLRIAMRVSVLFIAVAFGNAAHAGGGGSNMSLSPGNHVCVGVHQVTLPSGATAKVTSTYAGLRDSVRTGAQWDAVLSSLRDRADAAKAAASPRTDRAAELYRAAGADPEVAFSDSRLVGFDANDDVVVIAEHVGPAASFSLEAHQVQDGHHLTFAGESSQAHRYNAVRDGVLETIARYRVHVSGESPPADAFCTSNGYFRLKDGADVAGDAQLFVTFLDMPRITFSLNIHGLVQPANEPSFAERAARDLAEIASLGGQVSRLRDGRREYGGQAGQMVAISVSSDDGGNDVYKYFWHATGRPLDAYAPEIEAELLADDGHGVNQRVLDALWDDLMGGLQLRR
jgi:hypothetical protein